MASGVSPQVPQFLYEAGFGCKDFPERAGAVGVTQPRRVAAISTAERVADELDTRLGQVVGYQVRIPWKVSERFQEDSGVAVELDTRLGQVVGYQVRIPWKV